MLYVGKPTPKGFRAISGPVDEMERCFPEFVGRMKSYKGKGGDGRQLWSGDEDEQALFVSTAEAFNKLNHEDSEEKGVREIIMVDMEPVAAQMLLESFETVERVNSSALRKLGLSQKQIKPLTRAMFKEGWTTANGRITELGANEVRECLEMMGVS